MSNARIASILAAGGALLAALLLASPPEPSQPAAVTAHRVLVAEVGSGHHSRAIGFPGVTRAAQRADLAFLVAGRLAERPVQLGQRVASGAILARVEGKELANAVAVARAELARAEASRAQLERDAERVDALHQSRAATREELEKTTAGLDAARATESAARAGLAETERRQSEAVLRAPFAGTVVAVYAEPGEHVPAGRRILSLSGAGGLEVEIGVPDALVEAIVDGQVVTVTFPGSEREAVPGTVQQVGRDAGGTGALFPVLVALGPSPALPAGLSARVEIELATDDALLVPVSAVVDPGGRRPSLYRVVDGHAQRLAVEVRGFVGDRVAVTGALAAGDQVIIGGQRGLLDGEAVEIAR